MSAPSQPAAMNLFERYLTAWVALCIVAGILFGQFLKWYKGLQRRT